MKADVLNCNSLSSPLSWRAGQALGGEGEGPLAALPEFPSKQNNPGLPGRTPSRTAGPGGGLF